ncbi:MAG: response regulator transcription factor [Proteobacteria bacterium]|uniref:response regulator transcription factor n=1 Tax=Rudaea sp. TaxID=2136325 RepID=UPI0032208032|nr:response regulator transcription factor [Pseudomonadota bacterium]
MDAQTPESFLVVDDEPALLARLCRILRLSQGEDAALHCAGSIAEAKAIAASSAITMALVDLGLPDGNGVELIGWLRAREADLPILVISAWSTEEMILDALRAGATGYLLKERDDEEIAMLLRTALKGGAPIDPFIARRILAATNVADVPARHDAAVSIPAQDALSAREVQILELVAQGLSNLEIAERTNLSRWTVASHVKSIYAKFAVHSRTAAVRAGRGSGVLR